MKLSDLKPNAENPRKITNTEIANLRKSLNRFGDLSGIVFNRRTKRLVGGHQRQKALPPESQVVSQELKEKSKVGTVAMGHVEIKGECFTYREVDWDAATEKAANISANQHGGSWDLPKLGTWIKDLDKSGFDLGVLGFSEKELAQFGLAAPRKGLIDEDEVPRARKRKPTAIRGHIYALGSHRLMCGDSTSAGDVGRLMGSDTADIIFTDPPWNVDYGRDAKPGNSQGWKPRTILNDKMNVPDWAKFLEGFSVNLAKFSKPGAPIYMVMSAQEWPTADLALRTAGFHWSSTIIWAKDRLVMSRKDYHTQYEPIWYGWNSQAPRLHPMKDRGQSDLWQCKRPQKSELHPTTKPVELVERALTNSSDQGALVLELFGGSGSTLIASEKTGRKCFAMELDPQYVDVIVSRWEQYSGQKAKLLKG